MRRILALVFACFLTVATTTVNAAPIVEAENDGQAVNNGFATAQSVPGSAFTLPVPATVFNPPGFATATILGGNGGSDVDFYRFSAAGGQIYFDMDNDPYVFDSMIALFDAGGNLLAFNDDSPVDPGSNLNGLDAFLGVYTLPGPGDYYFAISTFPNISVNQSSLGNLIRPDNEHGGVFFGSGATGTFQSGPQVGSDYTLHISLQNPADLTVPEPASLALWGIGVIGIGWVSRRRRMKNKAAA